ncbi:MAG: oligoendopeptidase F [Salinirussus sp.]
MSAVPERDEIDEANRWAIEELFESDDDWEAALEDAREALAEIEAFEGRVTEDAETLHTTLETYERVMREVELVTTYAHLRRDEDTRDDAGQAMATRAQSLSADADAATSFLEPELQELDDKTIETYVDQIPALGEYEHYLDDVLRTKPHTRSTEVETLLADLGEVVGAPGEIYNLLANADMSFPSIEGPDGEEVEITLNNFTTLQRRRDRDFRRRTYEAFYDEWETVRNAVATSYRKSVLADEKLATARNYDSARAAALHGPNIPESVYDTLVETVRDSLDPLHRHARLKRAVSGADELRPWDLYIPLTETESPEIPWSQAREYVVDAVAPLGTAYQNKLAAGLDDRWVDVYETRGKQSGAYSAGIYDSQPYVLLNYQSDVESLFTVAHELGHAMHSELASEAQPYVYADYTIFIAEIASTVNETLLTHHLLDELEDEHLRRHVLNEFLERVRSTLYRQTMFAEFEQRTHERSAAGEPLTADRLDELYGELKETYYAPATLDDRIAREWMRIPHFYRAFYVFQYATGISAAIALVDAIRDEGAPAAERYREFLSRGSSAYPLELLDEAGVDMTEAAPIEAAVAEYESVLDEVEELL